jgi:hypothetical protein
MNGVGKYIYPFDLSAVQSFDKLRTNGIGVWSPLKNPFALSLSKGELMQRADLKK